jgi:hypothetical protein
VKIIIIRLPDVETEMLVEIQKKNKSYVDLWSYESDLLRGEYPSLAKSRQSACRASIQLLAVIVLCSLHFSDSYSCCWLLLLAYIGIRQWLYLFWQSLHRQLLCMPLP